jgi:hypothetical protein
MTVSTVGRLALARSEPERRALVRAFARAGRERLLAFDLVDDHAHAAISGERPRMIARDLRRSLAVVRPDLEFEAPHLKLVDTRRYLRWLLTYLLVQPAKHGLDAHPALWTGSCFQDLVGARLLTGFSVAPLRAALPRLRLWSLFRDVGLEEAQLPRAPDDLLRRAGVGRLTDLAAGVYAVDPEFVGRSSLVVAARTLASAVGVQLGFSRTRLAPFLGATPQTVGRLASRRLAPAAEQALRLRFGLEERVQRRGRPAA